MPRARLTLTIPEGAWIGDVSREYPSVRFRILAALADGGTGVGHAELSGPDLPDVVAAVHDREEVTALDLLHRHEDTALIQFETTTPLLLLAVQDSGIPLEMPFDIEGGEATWDVTAPRDSLSALGDQLDAFGVSFTVEHIRERIEPDPLLTDRQERLLRAAADHGYYDTPRECSLTELAEEVGIAKSTCSETLHRAESRIVTEFLDADDNTTLK
ncbi:MAG: helix-turn-helix domain-containing protein [Halobacteriaceae archaeon]